MFSIKILLCIVHQQSSVRQTEVKMLARLEGKLQLDLWFTASK